MTKATIVVAVLLLCTCVCAAAASDEAISHLTAEDQIQIETLAWEYDRLRTTGLVTADLARLLQAEACEGDPTPGVAGLMRLAARHWRESAVEQSLTAAYASCLSSQIDTRGELASIALEILPQLPDEPGRESALSLMTDNNAPTVLRAKAARTFAMRSTPLPQEDLLSFVQSTSHEELFNAAAYALRRSNDPRIVPVLVASVNRFWNPAVRLTLQARIDLVQAAAMSPDPQVRDAGTYALRRLTEGDASSQGGRAK